MRDEGSLDWGDADEMEGAAKVIKYHQTKPVGFSNM